MAKKPDLVSQQLDRIRSVRPALKSRGKAAAAEDSSQSNAASTSGATSRHVDEYQNRDAAARPNAPRDPVTLGTAVDNLIEQNRWGKHAELATVMADWSDIIGSEFAAHVKPVGFDADKAILVLQADSTAWATQTRILSVEILRKIDDTVGVGVVASLDIQGPAPVRKPGGKYRVKGRGPRDTYG